MQINKRESVLLVILTIIIFVVLGLRWLVLPEYNNWITQKSKLAELKLAGQINNTAGNELIDSTAGTASELETFFIAKTGNENLHRYFQGYVKDSGLELGSIYIREESGVLPPGFLLVSINASFNGTQVQAMRLLEDIELSKKFIAVESFSMTPDKNQKIDLVVKFNIYCIENGLDSGFDFVPEKIAPADGFRFYESNGAQTNTDQSGDNGEG